MVSQSIIIVSFYNLRPSGTSAFIWKSSKIHSKPTSFVNATMQGENKKGFYMYNAPNHLNPFQQERMYKSGMGYIYANRSSHKRQKERHDKKKNTVISIPSRFNRKETMNINRLHRCPMTMRMKNPPGQCTRYTQSI